MRRGRSTGAERLVAEVTADRDGKVVNAAPRARPTGSPGSVSAASAAITRETATQHARSTGLARRKARCDADRAARSESGRRRLDAG